MKKHKKVSSQAQDHSSKSGRIQSRDSVVENILKINAGELEEGAVTEAHQLRRLVQAIRNRKGRFGLLFAICNEPEMQKRLSQEIISSLPAQQPTEIYLNGDEDSLLDVLFAAPGSQELLIVYGIELLLPSAEGKNSRREQTLQELQLRREQFRKLSRPVLIWMPEYVYTLIGQKAIDFWSWQSGGFFFGGGKIVFAYEQARQQSGAMLSRNMSHDLGITIPTLLARERELNVAVEALRSGKHVAMTGVDAGVGKTALAAQIANHVRDDYPDGQIIISLSDDSRSVSKALQKAVQALGPTSNLPNDVEVLTALYRSFLAGKRVLIVVDDVPDAASARPFLPPENNSLIITSRKSVNLSNLVNISLDHLLPEEARKLFLRFAPHVSQSIADQICFICDYLPLAIIVSACFLSSERNVMPSDYAAELAGKSKTLLPSGISSEVTPSLLASLNITYERLSPEESRVFRCITVFQESFDSEAEGVICDDQNNYLLTGLVKRGLVLNDTSSKRFSLHPVVREFALSLFSGGEETKARDQHAAHYLQVLWKADELYKKGGDSYKAGLELFEVEWSNIQAGQAWVAGRVNENLTAAKLCVDYPNAGAYFLTLRRTPDEVIPWLESAVIAARVLKSRKLEIGHLSNLGNMYLMQGKVNQAIESYEQTLNIAREINDRESERFALGRLGDAYYASGSTDRAIRLNEMSLQIAREINDREGEAHALSTLGIAYLHLGDVSRATELLEQSLEIERATGNLRGVSAELIQLGNAHATKGDIRRARSMYEEALELARKVGDKRIESNALGSLGYAHAVLSNPMQAIQLYVEQLRIVRELGDRSGEGRALGSIGNAYKALGDIYRAVEFHEQALSVARELNNRASEGYALGNLGNLYHLVGQSRRSIDFYEQALTISREVGDRRHEAVALGSLGNAHASLGDYRRAIDLYQQELAILRQIGDRHHEASALGNLGLAYDSIGDRDRAIEMHHENLRIARELGNRRSEGAALANLGNIYAKSGDWNRAIQHYEARLSIAREIFDRHGECSALNNLGNINGSLGELARALTYYENALAISREVEDRRVEGNTLFNMSIVLAKLQRLPEAIARAEESLFILEEIEDPHAPEIRAHLMRLKQKDPHETIGYNIYRTTNPNLPKGEWTKLNDKLLTETRFIDKAENRDPSLEYYYYVTAVNAYGVESAPSTVFTAKPESESKT